MRSPLPPSTQASLLATADTSADTSADLSAAAECAVPGGGGGGEGGGGGQIDATLDGLRRARVLAILRVRGSAEARSRHAPLAPPASPRHSRLPLPLSRGGASPLRRCQVAVARGMELAAMGCTAIEVTLDSPQWEAILRGLRRQLPASVLLIA
jgi:hypothetical protein